MMLRMLVGAFLSPVLARPRHGQLSPIGARPQGRRASDHRCRDGHDQVRTGRVHDGRFLLASRRDPSH